MRNQLVTVFGGSGQIGRYVVHRLAERGARLRVPSRNPHKALFLKPMGAVGQIDVIRAAFAPEAALAAQIEGAWAVVYAIGILAGSPDRFDLLQHRLPGQIARLAKAAGARRFVLISAIGADPSSPIAYQRSKGLGERAVLEAFAEATVLRPSVVFGPEDQFFNRFARMAQLSPVLPLIGGGHTRFQPVYVADVADAVVAALTRDDARGRTFELGGPKVYSFAELMRYLLKVLGRRRALVSLPFGLARLQARLLEWLPQPPLTRDQVEMLKADNVVAPGAAGLAELGIQPTPLELIVPGYLQPFATADARARLG